MKKALLIVSLFLCFQSFSQSRKYNPKPSTSRFYNSKFSTFPVKPGDILIYNVKTDSGQYELVITVRKFGPDINFDFIIPSKSYFGNIIIPPASVEKAIQYDTTFDVERKVLTDKSVLWLSKKSFTELFKIKETEMDMGEGKETFVRGNTTILKINYKGKQKFITMYNVSSKGGKDEKDKPRSIKTFAVLNDIRNPLMVQSDINTSITLKEVR